MTDHDRLCELLRKAWNDDGNINIYDVADWLNRLNINGPDGLRVVPVEPTEKMLSAGQDSGDWGPAGYDDHPKGAACPEECYRAMLRAAGGERDG